MGLLSEGVPLSWNEIKLALEQIRNYALDQLIRVFHKYKNRQKDIFTWGDEVELILVRFDHENKNVQLLLKGHQLLPILLELNNKIDDGECRIAWHPEACDFVVEVFKDSCTLSPFRDELFKDDPDIKDDHIHLDSSTAGWGCCCLQVTFQAESFEESIHLYDQLLPLCPIMLCLSAASPIWRGYLSDIDCRWNIISEAADDRTIEEKKEKNLQSRYSSAPSYLADKNKHLNDIDYPVDQFVVSKLIEQGMPETLSRHFGHLFIRDPLVILKEFLHPVDDTNSYHFENLNSLVWNTLRLKPPPLNDDLLGWRVEFRPMDIQLSDFENAALVVFLALITRVIISYGLDITIPISQINENMNKAHNRDSIRREKFYFQYNNQISQMFINDIINGNNGFLGLVPLVRKYIYEREDIDADTRHTIEQYLLLISKRAAGTLLTNASWIRQFVLSHSSYKQDSIVSEEIQYDLIWKMVQIENGHENCPLIKNLKMDTHTDLHAK
ncbi:unnamed protein product [Rotaria sp. Silwood1]|nr:unnamed protein product [Rotaria sp. Silwood1]